MVSGGEYQDVLVDALRGALGRDRPPRLPPVPDDVKSVGVQTPANVQNPGGHPSGTDARGVCPACRRAPANWRACGECQRMCADGGSSGDDDKLQNEVSTLCAKVRASETIVPCRRERIERAWPPWFPGVGVCHHHVATCQPPRSVSP